MPIHDWTRMEAGDFHHFHHRWIAALADALNTGGLPAGYMAMMDRVFGQPLPDGIAGPSIPGSNSVTRQDKPPTARFVARYEKGAYSQRADQVVIRHVEYGDVAVIVVVSPGHKGGRVWLRAFVERAADLVNRGIHLLVVDLFPPTPQDPHGIHKAIWDEFDDQPFDAPPAKPLTLASYVGGEVPTAFVEPVGVGDLFPSMPLFLSETWYVPAPLEKTYHQAWAVYPASLKERLERPAAD
jgi:hypothetical protein